MEFQQFFPHQISITGPSAVGTSSAFVELQTRLPSGIYRFVSGGGIMRQKARDLGFGEDIEGFAAHCRQNPKARIDQGLDTMVNLFGITDFGVLESRLGHITWPGAYKVYLTCPLDIRAERRARQKGISVDVARQLITQRDQDDSERYKELYGPGVIWTPDKFDLVLDTSEYDPAQIATKVISAHQTWSDIMSARLVKSPVFRGFAREFSELWIP